MNLEAILEMWKKDSVIDEVLLDQAALKIPQLHQKYLTLLSEYNLLYKKQAHKLKVLEHQKNLYYSGRAKPEEYEDEPFDYKVMKSDVPSWVAVDEEVQKVELKQEYYSATIRVLEDVLKQIHQMSYNIKNAIEWRRFTSGA